MKTCLVLVTHNRLEYTKKALNSVLDDDQSDFELRIWDNASTDDTPDFLRSLNDSRIKQVYLSQSNAGQTAAMNRMWQSSDAPLLAKLDNDCMVQRGWIEKLSKAHQDILRLGAVACWHYSEEDFSRCAAERKIIMLGEHKVFQHPWVCGSGFVMKRTTYNETGPWPEGSADIGTTGYFMRLAKKGYINGWYLPLILQHHMDDPLSPYCCYYDDETLQKVRSITYTLRNRNIQTMKERMKRRKVVLEVLLKGSPRPLSYSGWRGKLRRYVPSIDKVLYRIGWPI